MDEISGFSKTERLLLLGAAAVILLAGVKMLSGFLGPLIVSIVAAMLFSIIARWLMKKGISPALANLIAFALFIIILVLVFLLIVISVVPVLTHLPRYENGLAGNLDAVNTALAGYGVPKEASIPSQAIAGSLSGIAKEIIVAIIGQVSALIIVIFTTFFFLLEAAGFTKKIRFILGGDNARVFKSVKEFRQMLVDYIIIRTKVNLVVGILFGAGLWALGVEGFVLWAFMMFVLGYVPYIGFYLAIIPPVLLAWIEISPAVAFLIVIIAIIVNQFAESILFPELTGHTLSISPAIVFISLLFWGFLLGGPGFILGVPLTILVLMVARCFDETRWIAVLIEEKAPDDPSDTRQD